jgi:hypothetical protein
MALVLALLLEVEVEPCCIYHVKIDESQQRGTAGQMSQPSFA